MLPAFSRPFALALAVSTLAACHGGPIYVNPTPPPNAMSILPNQVTIPVGSFANITVFDALYVGPLDVSASTTRAGAVVPCASATLLQGPQQTVGTFVYSVGPNNTGACYLTFSDNRGFSAIATVVGL